MWFNLQRDGTGYELSNIKDTFCRKFAATNVSSAPRKYVQGWSPGWSLKSSSYDDGWAKCKKKKTPDVSDPNQNVETTWNSKRVQKN